jgi:superfamily II DNA or RNA helicase
VFDRGSFSRWVALCGVLMPFPALGGPLPPPNAPTGLLAVSLDPLWEDGRMHLPQLPEWPKADADVPIRRSTLSLEQEQHIRQYLSFDNPEYYKALNNGQSVLGIPKTIRAYEKARQLYRLPRHAPFRKLGIREPRYVFPETEKLPWEFTGTLRDTQIPAFAALEHQLIYRKDGILVLSCGSGKTVLGIAAFGWQQRPALAVVTQLFIAEQWKHALLQFTNIPEDRIGLIGEGRNEWDRDFVISTVQSLASKEDLPPEFYRRFGLVFFDEVHRLGAPLFGRVVSVFTGLRIGLTATLERADGMHALFMLHVGKVFYEDKQQALIPRVYFLHTPIQKDVRGFRQWGGHGKLNIAKIVTHLSRLPERQTFVQNAIRKAYEKNRKTLVLSDRKDELQQHERVLALAYGQENVGLCVGTLHGRMMSHDARRISLEKPIILATSQLVKEGLDKKEIDTLLWEYPISAMGTTEQGAGRVLRVDDEKRPPVIVVFVDSGVYVTEHGERRYPFTTKALKMQQTFKKLHYDIVKGV